jgi:hypothetical protein
MLEDTKSKENSSVVSKPKRRSLLLVIWIIILMFLGWDYYIYAQLAEIRNKTTLGNLHQIQMGLEIYAVNHGGEVPMNIYDLVLKRFLSDIPENPFTRKPMRNIEYGSSPYRGEFTYIPIASDGRATEYILVGYGTEKTKSGKDYNNDGVDDHILLELDSRNVSLETVFKGGEESINTTVTPENIR